jgi:hypothetical protein
VHPAVMLSAALLAYNVLHMKTGLNIIPMPATAQQLPFEATNR